MRRITIKGKEPARNVGSNVPDPKWWVFDTLLGERDGWIVRESNWSFVCFTNTGARFSMRHSLEKALEDFG